MSTLEWAKIVWAGQNLYGQRPFGLRLPPGHRDGDTLTLDDIKRFLPEPPKCPAGGKYELGAVGEGPSCSIHGRSQPYQTEAAPPPPMPAAAKPKLAAPIPKVERKREVKTTAEEARPEEEERPEKPLVAYPIVEKAIREELNKPTGELTQVDLEKFMWLDLGGNKLTEVPEGLEKLTKLEGLRLGHNQLTDVKGLEKLTQLRELTLGDNPDLTKAQDGKLRKALPNCKISSDHPLTKEESAKVIEAAIRKAAWKPSGELTKADLEKVTNLRLHDNGLTDVQGLEKLTKLTHLGLAYNQLTDVKGLEKLTQLGGLGLGGNQLTDVKGLEKLTQLKNLSLHRNKLTEVKGLEKLTQLTELVLFGNKLTDASGLEKLTQLKELGLGLNQLTDLKGLEKLTQLLILELDNNQLTDVKGLEKLTQLKNLSLYANRALTKAQIAELRRALPKCRIIH